MLICIDFDETYTADVDMWNKIICTMKDRGHEVICCTMRYPQEGDDVEETIGKHCKIYYSSREAKMEYLSKMNICPHIWIDDKPAWIFTDG